MKYSSSLSVLAFVFVSVTACSSQNNESGQPGNGSCTSIAGKWGVGGTCGPDTCQISQNGCSTNFVCGGGSTSYAGSVSGSSVQYSGHTAGGPDGSCQGTIDGSTMSGTCTVGGATCSFTAARE